MTVDGGGVEGLNKEECCRRSGGMIQGTFRSRINQVSDAERREVRGLTRLTMQS